MRGREPWKAPCVRVREQKRGPWARHACPHTRWPELAPAAEERRPLIPAGLTMQAGGRGRRGFCAGGTERTPHWREAAILQLWPAVLKKTRPLLPDPQIFRRSQKSGFLCETDFQNWLKHFQQYLGQTKHVSGLQGAALLPQYLENLSG